MKRIPAIKSVMTPFPYSVASDASMVEAMEFLQQHGIHHLPVTEGGELVGVLTYKDIKLYLGTEAGNSKQDELKVKDVYIREPYIVDLNERLDRVLRTMGDRHIGSALVTRNGKLAGLFTDTDACRSFADYLQDQFKPPDGSNAA